MRLRLLLALALGTTICLPEATAPRFYPDDPLWTHVDTQDASPVRPDSSDPFTDPVVNMFGRPGDRTANVRAQNINTIDEVPDSSWFTNRAGVRPLTADVMMDATALGPANGVWTILWVKSAGTTPGLRIRDAAGDEWFVKFDPPGHNEMATGAEIVSTHIFRALGYNVPDNHLAFIRPDQLTIAPAARITTVSGTRPLVWNDVAKVLKRAAAGPGGDYRVLASRRIDGLPVGPFLFHGTRPDDPNDVVPHEHRRELRAIGTFAAWLNHVDCKSENTFDTLVRIGDRTVVRHYLIDFGSTIGSGGVTAREPFEGWQQVYEGGETLKSILSLGLHIEPWRTVAIYQSPSVGAIPAHHDSWDPERWRARFPNATFARARVDDKFWAARRVQALTREHLASAVRAARYADPRSADAVLRFLTERRAVILRRYLPAVNPITEVRLDAAGGLTCANAAVDADVAPRPRAYRAVWWRFDNHTGESTPIGDSRAETCAFGAPVTVHPDPGAFLRVDLSADSRTHPSWSAPVHAYFRGDGSAWMLVGFERLPAGNPPGAAIRR